jgi:hypothetical protein
MQAAGDCAWPLVHFLWAGHGRAVFSISGLMRMVIDCGPQIRSRLATTVKRSKLRLPRAVSLRIRIARENFCEVAKNCFCAKISLLVVAQLRRIRSVILFPSPFLSGRRQTRQHSLAARMFRQQEYHDAEHFLPHSDHKERAERKIHTGALRTCQSIVTISQIR